MERNCEQSHCAACMRPVFLVEQKALQWQGELQCSATIQPSYSQCGCPHTAAPPTMLLWLITRRRGGPCQRSSRFRKRSWKPGRCGWEDGRDCRTVWVPSEAERQCFAFVKTRLMIYSPHSVTRVLVIREFCLLVAETVGSDSTKEQQLTDNWRGWWHDKASSVVQHTDEVTLPFDSAEYELKNITPHEAQPMFSFLV